MSKRKMFQIGNSLTEALEETAYTAASYSGQLRVEVLPLKKIEVDPDNPRELLIDISEILTEPDKNDPLYDRKKQEIAGLQPMAESIKREGIINPIVVYKYGEKYRLVAGERRVLASALANQEYIQAKILEKKPPELKLRLLQWVENVERENLSLWERLKNLEKIVNASREGKKNNKAITATDIKQMIGCALSHAMNYCYVLNADETIKKVIEENKIRNLEKAALIAQITSPKLRINVMNACIEGATLKQLKKMIIMGKQEETQRREKLAVSKSKRGRQAAQVNFGNTKKLSSVKFLVNLVSQNEKYRFLEKTLSHVNWNDFGEASQAFKIMLHAIEENE